MVLPIRGPSQAMNAPHVKHVAANFKDTVEEAVEPVEPWVHTAAAVETWAPCYPRQVRHMMGYDVI